MKKLTVDHLRRVGACKDGLAKFRRLYPDGLDLTPANACLLASEFGSIDLQCMARCLVDVFAPSKLKAWARYHTQAWAERHRGLDALYQRYGRTRDWTSKAYAEEAEIQRRFREKTALGAAWFLGGADDPA